jgi:hypothetical protein
VLKIEKLAAAANPAESKNAIDTDLNETAESERIVAPD